jgi:hypothetical protein
VVDWSGHDGTPAVRSYRSIARREFHEHSPTYERLCLGVAEDSDVLARLGTLPRAKQQPLLLLGAVRFLGGPIDSYPAFRAFVVEQWDEVAETMLARRTQTNEPRRCAALLPVLAALPQPLALLEVGASAGLCLYPDRYGYRYGTADVPGRSRIVFDCAVRGPVPVPPARPTVAWRAGLDLAPVDVRDDEAVRWLRSLIWPEQTERFAILDRAVEIARAEPVDVRAGDLTTDVVALAADAPPDATLVVFHSAVLAYLSDSERDAFRSQLAEVAANRHTVWLANEAPGVVVDLPTPPGAVPFVVSLGKQPLAFADPHGAWLDWFGELPTGPAEGSATVGP